MSATPVIEIPEYLKPCRILEEVYGIKEENGAASLEQGEGFYFIQNRTIYVQRGKELITTFRPRLDLNTAIEAAEALADKLQCEFTTRRYQSEAMDGTRRTVIKFSKIPVTCGCEHSDYVYVVSEKTKAENVYRLILEVLDELERGKQKNETA